MGACSHGGPGHHGIDEPWARLNRVTLEEPALGFSVVISDELQERMLSRKDKESLYLRKMMELQARWGNPYDDDWKFIEGWDTETLDRELAETISHLRFEKILSGAKWVALTLVLVFVGLGLIGLLIFGIRQLFP